MYLAKEVNKGFFMLYLAEEFNGRVRLWLYYNHPYVPT